LLLVVLSNGNILVPTVSSNMFFLQPDDEFSTFEFSST